MSIKKIFAFVIAAVLAVSLVACGSPAAAGEDTSNVDETVYTWRIGYGSGGTEENNPAIYYMNRVKEKAEELSGGRLNVELYPASALGTTQELPSGLVDGTVDSAVLPTQFLASIVPDFYCLDISGTFSDAGELAAALNESDSVICDHAAQKGIQIASWIKLYPRYTITVDPISTLSDYTAKKLWFATSAVLSNKATSIGAIPCNFSGQDLAVSLQNGTVDGAWCDVSLMTNFALFDFAKNVTTLPGDPMVAVLALSDTWFQTLPADLQEIVITAAKECVALQFERCEDVTDTLMANLTNNGVTISEPSSELTSAYFEAVSGEKEWLMSEHPETEEFMSELISMSK